MEGEGEENILPGKEGMQTRIKWKDCEMYKGEFKKNKFSCPLYKPQQIINSKINSVKNESI